MEKSQKIESQQEVIQQKNKEVKVQTPIKENNKAQNQQKSQKNKSLQQLDDLSLSQINNDSMLQKNQIKNDSLLQKSQMNTSSLPYISNKPPFITTTNDQYAYQKKNLDLSKNYSQLLESKSSQNKNNLNCIVGQEGVIQTYERQQQYKNHNKLIKQYEKHPRKLKGDYFNMEYLKKSKEKQENSNFDHMNYTQSSKNLEYDPVSMEHKHHQKVLEDIQKNNKSEIKRAYSQSSVLVTSQILKSSNKLKKNQQKEIEQENNRLAKNISSIIKRPLPTFKIVKPLPKQQDPLQKKTIEEDNKRLAQNVSKIIQRNDNGNHNSQFFNGASIQYEQKHVLASIKKKQSKYNDINKANIQQVQRLEQINKRKPKFNVYQTISPILADIKPAKKNEFKKIEKENNYLIQKINQQDKYYEKSKKELQKRNIKNYQLKQSISRYQYVGTPLKDKQYEDPLNESLQDENPQKDDKNNEKSQKNQEQDKLNQQNEQQNEDKKSDLNQNVETNQENKDVEQENILQKEKNEIQEQNQDNENLNKENQQENNENQKEKKENQQENNVQQQDRNEKQQENNESLKDNKEQQPEKQEKQQENKEQQLENQQENKEQNQQENKEQNQQEKQQENKDNSQEIKESQQVPQKENTDILDQDQQKNNGNQKENNKEQINEQQTIKKTQNEINNESNNDKQNQQQKNEQIQQQNQNDVESKEQQQGANN